MEIKKLNTILSNLHSPNPKYLRFIQKEDTHLGVGDTPDGVQGESNNYNQVYEILGEKELFLKIFFSTDSYGDNDFPTGCKIVKARKVEKLIYE